MLHLPWFWGVEYQRLYFYEVHASEYNTLFIGASGTRYQIDPKIFDSINPSGTFKTKSYNFGVDGACPTELFSIFKHLTNNKPAALKHVFVELTLIDNFDQGQLHSLRRKSYYGLEQYVYALPLTLESNYSWAAKGNILLFDLCNLIEGTFKINMLKSALDFKKAQAGLERARTVKNFIGLTTDEMPQKISIKGKYANRHEKFLMESIPELKANTESAQTMFTDRNFLAGAKTDGAYLKMVHEMLNIAHQKGVDLIFVLCPRLSKENYLDLLPVYYNIPKANRIQLADANEYPDFYKVEYSYDIKHINKSCVPIYTTAISKKFLDLERQQ